MVKDYDPEEERRQREEDAADDEVLETTADLAEAKRIYRKRYDGTDTFEQAQRGYDRLIDDDRISKIADRADEDERNAGS